MKKVYIITLTAALGTAFLGFQRTGNHSIEKYFAKNGHKNAGGAPTGKTGAPGETNCTGCHAGTALDGANENVLIVASGITPVSTYTPGATYNVALSMNSQPAKKGFQATALDGSGNMAGNFIGGANTQVTAGATGRKYANQTPASNTGTTTLWGWTWTAPTSNVGPVTFYVASNAANNNATTSGDAIYLSTHVIQAGSSVGMEEVEENELSVAYAPVNNSLVLDFASLSVGELSINIVDMSGRSVFNTTLGQAQIGKNHQNVVLPNQIKNGIYLVNLFVNNKAMSGKIMIQK